MKKLFAILTLAFAMSSCSSDIDNVKQTGLSVDSHLRSIDEAVNIAETLLSTREASSKSQSLTSYRVAEVEVVGSSISRTNVDTLIYIVNFEDDKGFVLVSAPKSCEPIIGYSDKGLCQIPTDVNENPSFTYFLDAAKSYVETQSTIGDIFIPDPTTPVTFTSSVFPRLTVEWGQYYPEGEYCPNKKAGCGPTALAQVLSYVKQPESLELKYTGTSDKIALKWSELTLHKKSFEYIPPLSVEDIREHVNDCEASMGTHTIIGLMCAELGFRCNAEYKESSTSVNFYDVEEVCAFLLSPTYVSGMKYEINDETFYDTLEGKSNIIMLSGIDVVAGGHIWICDGADRVRKTYTVTKFDGTKEKRIEDTYYNHYNWGWCGEDNGYFLAGVFKTTQPASRRDYDLSKNLMYFVVTKP